MRIYQVPQHAFIWLISGVLLASLPHLLIGPGWLWAVVAGAAGWRLLVQRGRALLPGRILRFIMLLGALLGTLYHHGTILGPDAATCLLVAAFALKLLETFRLRDAYVVIVLGYFVLATAFLFHQGPLVAMYVVFGLVVLTAALIGINQPDPLARSRAHLRLSATMMAQAIPLMLLLFVMVPRMGPLWSLEMDGGARTGMSDDMSPGDISRLSESSELAFRVEFEDGRIPPPAQRYWRGLTFSDFNGRRWSQARISDIEAPDYIHYAGAPAPDWFHGLAALAGQTVDEEYRYRIVQEATGRNWLFALAVPFVEDRQIGMARDLRLIRRDEINRRISYDVTSHARARIAMPLPDWERRLNLRLPAGGDPRSRELAGQWRAEADTEREYAERLLRHFNQQEFHYTLSPPRLGENSIDDFLFESRRGFCEHYASAYAFMMRAAGIPARVVVGYQGGEMNPLGEYLQVRQYDAHAWTEIWLEDHGWVEIDPTAAVAPERIEYGLRRTLADELGGAAAAMRRLADNPLLASLRNSAGYLQFAWQKWVLGYDQDTQLEFLRNWLGDTSPMRVAMVLLVGGVILVLPVALWVLLSRSTPGPGPMAREYLWLQRWASRRGVLPRPGEAPGDLVRRASIELPRHAEALNVWRRAFERCTYAGYSDDPGARRAMRQARRRVRRG